MSFDNFFLSTILGEPGQLRRAAPVVPERGPHVLGQDRPSIWSVFRRAVRAVCGGLTALLSILRIF